MSTKAETRIQMEQYMLKHKGPHTVAGLAKAMKVDEADVRRRIQHLVTGLVAVNVSEGQRPTLYQHSKHYNRKQVKAPNVVNRRDPVVNSKMPNGSRSYWAQQMARRTKIQRFDVDAFTTHILKTMEQRGTSHEQISAETGLALGMVTRMRRDGRRPTADAFLALCHWANADPMRFHMLPADKPTTSGPFAGLIR